MRRIIMLAVLLLSTFGCATKGEKLNKLSLGMSKSEVMSIMGKPTHVKAADSVEILVYEINDWQMDAWTDKGAYWCVFEGGKLSKYGRPGDFGTATPPTQKLIIEQVK